MITGKIADWQVTASSVYPVEWDKDCAERYARVYQPDRLGWCAKYKSASEWLQVDLGVASKVIIIIIITGQPTHSVRGQTRARASVVVCRRLSSVTLAASKQARQ